jgi:5-bromo-4-chloroindolyl phosphate hydrolysis protein
MAGKPVPKADMRTKEGRRIAVAGAASFLLFILPVPILVKGALAIFRGDIIMLGVCAALFALAIFGAVVARRGIMLEAQFLSRKIARAPLLPYKTAGGILIGAATFFAALILTHNGFLYSGAFGIGAVAGTLLLYGLDPMGAKGVAIDSGVGIDELTDALESARAKVSKTEIAAKAIRNTEYKARLNSTLGWANKIINSIEEDPRDLRRARKFMNVYLDGLQQVTEKYAATHGKADTGALEENFREMLVEMENTFKEQHAKLMDDDLLDLDIQIEVLKTRLKREGVL